MEGVGKGEGVKIWIFLINKIKIIKNKRQAFIKKEIGIKKEKSNSHLSVNTLTCF